VEQGLAKAFAQDDLEIVRFDSQTKSFVHWRPSPIARDAAPNPPFPFSKASLMSGALADWLFLRVVARNLLDQWFRRLDFTTHVRQFAELMPSITVTKKLRLARALDICGHRARSSQLADCVNETWGRETEDFEPANTMQFTSHDVLLLCGASWRHIDFNELKRLKKRVGFSVAGFIYDLIPVASPGLVTVEQYLGYAQFLVQMAEICDWLIVPCERTARRLREALLKEGIQGCHVEVVPLCGGLDAVAPALPPKRIQSLLKEERFVLHVSPIRMRKNQFLAYALWKKLYAEHGLQTPRLVFAGPLTDPCVLLRLRNDPHWHAIAAYVSDPTDQELAWLYENAVFSIYPSIETGVGMPILESLERGRPCVTTAAPCARGISEQLHEVGDDETRWLDILSRLIDGVGPTEMRLEAGKTAMRTWTHVAEDVREVVQSRQRGSIARRHAASFAGVRSQAPKSQGVTTSKNGDFPPSE
jgi:glycosyltransferase involved in cell wall biosynthesis